MVKILFGDYGTGKSTYIRNEIDKNCKNNIRSFLIVPEQETVIKERQIASLLPSYAQRFCEVSNFTRLADLVFRKEGGLKTNYVSKSAKNLIMYRAICECHKKGFSGYKIAQGHEKGCIKLFLEAIGEFKSYCVTIESLEKAASCLDNAELKNRISDIIMVWATYESILSEQFSDPSDRITLLAETVLKTSFFKGTSVYFDSFYGFTPSQFKLLEAVISTADNVTFAFDCPPYANEGSTQYARMAKTAKSIISLCKRLNKEYERVSSLFEKDLLHKKEDLSLLSKNLWDFSKKGLKSNGSITLVMPADEFEECELVASQISSLIRQGYKYSDIAIIARNIDTYRGILDYALKKRGISHFTSSPSDWLTKPFMKMIFSALSFVSSYRYQDIVAYAKCGYTDIDPKDLDDFERYITSWNIFGKKFKDDNYWTASPDGFVSYDSSKKSDKLENSSSALEKILITRDTLLDSISPLERVFFGTPTVLECCNAIIEFLTKNEIQKKLENERKEAEKYDAYVISQAWEAILDTLDTLYKVCKDVRVDINTFTTLLTLAFMDAKVGTIPTSEDIVLISDASLVRADNIKRVFILGANEGTFPANVSGGSVFSDVDKIALETVDINLSEKSDVRADDELMFFKNSVSVASHGVTVSALSSGIDGGKKEPSLGFKRIEELFDLQVTEADTFNKIYTLDDINELTDSTSGILLDVLLNNSDTSKKRDDLREESLRFSNETDVLSKETVSKIFKNHLTLSQTTMDTYVTCPFKYFSSYHLDLRSTDKYTFSSLESGNLMHKFLEIFMTRLRDNRTLFASLSDDEVKKVVNEIIDDYIASVCNGVNITNKLSYLFNRLKSYAYIFAKKMVTEFKYSKFSPEYLELKFKEKKQSSIKSANEASEKIAEPLKFKLDNGSTVSLIGTADRVDIYRDDENAYIRVADYKIGSKEFSEQAVDSGDGLQLLIYLFSLCKTKDEDLKKELLGGKSNLIPAGFFYIPLNVGKTTSAKDITENGEISQASEAEEVSLSSAFNGRFLDDEDLIKAQDPNPGGQFLPSKSKRGTSHYLSLDEFDELYKKMESSIITIASEMYNGMAHATPKEKSGMPACTYCDQRAFCRRRNK